MPVHERKMTALIGPSGCGKSSTFLRCFNRMGCVSCVVTRDTRASSPFATASAAGT
jgi:ABC-type phosphate transport system ATPase subunit